MDQSDKQRTVQITSSTFILEKKLSLIFGLLIGGMWMGEIVLGNLGGTSVLWSLRDVHPGIYRIAAWFALGAVGASAIGPLVAPYRTGNIRTALRVGIWSGLISGIMVLVTGIGMMLTFHQALMNDPSKPSDKHF